MNRWRFEQRVDLKAGNGDLIWPNALMMEGDNQAHAWQVQVRDGGKAVDLSQYGITAYFQRTDGKTVVAAGSAEGDKATVLLPQSAYAVPGQLLGVMRASMGGSNMTLAACRWTVRSAPDGDYIDPGHVVPSLPELLDRIAEMESATAAANAAAGSVSDAKETALSAAGTANAAAQAADEARAGIQGDISSLQSDIIAVKFGKDIDFSWAEGNISASGDMITGTQSNFYSRIFGTTEFKKLVIMPDVGYQCNIAYYDGEIFINRGTWTSDAVTISNDKSIRIMIATNAPSNNPIEDMLPHFSIVGFESELYDLATIKRKLDNMPKFNLLSHYCECDFTGNNVHVSFDDVSYALMLLQSGSLSSIYDVRLFSQARTLHETYGVCVTLNCFLFLSTQPTYDIGRISTMYKKEFQDAKSWLRFSFHSRDETTTYDGDMSLKDHYEYFVNSIYRMTGDYGCIDRVVRTQSFTGSIDNIKSVLTCDYAPVAFLGSDINGRLGYYLNNENNEKLWNRGKYLDLDNGVIFIKSLPRLDTDDYLESAKAEMQKTKRTHKFVEIFAHANVTRDNVDEDVIDRIGAFLDWIGHESYEKVFLSDELS